MVADVRSKLFGQLAAVVALSASLALAAVGNGATDRITFQRDGERLTLRCDDVPADQVLRRLEAEGLATLSGPASVSERRVTIDVEGESLEVVMRHLLRQAGVTNHAVRYDGKTGLATFVVLSEEAPKLRERPDRRDRPERRERSRGGRRARMAATATEAPQAAPPPQAEQPEQPEEAQAPPAPPAPEQGFGSLLMGN